MKEIDWEPKIEKIKPSELTNEDKKIVEECSKIEMEIKEIISMINLNEEE